LPCPVDDVPLIWKVPTEWSPVSVQVPVEVPNVAEQSAMVDGLGLSSKEVSAVSLRRKRKGEGTEVLSLLP
jgi:hypothetical protein